MNDLSRFILDMNAIDVNAICEHSTIIAAHIPDELVALAQFHVEDFVSAEAEDFHLSTTDSFSLQIQSQPKLILASLDGFNVGCRCKVCLSTQIDEEGLHNAVVAPTRAS